MLEAGVGIGMFLPRVQVLTGTTSMDRSGWSPSLPKTMPGGRAVLNWENWTLVGAGSQAPLGTACPCFQLLLAVAPGQAEAPSPHGRWLE